MDHLFLSGEFTATLPLCYKRNELWRHTTHAQMMRPFSDGIKYGKFPNTFKSVLWYCSVDDENTRKNNVLCIETTNTPCWPDVRLLSKWDDRRTKLFSAVANGFVDDVKFMHWSDGMVAKTDTVVKVGNMHVGEGKLLVKQGDVFPAWENLASLEPYVEGRSVRVYVVNDVVGCVEYTNERSWIKNTEGAEVHEVILSDALVEHAKRVHEHFEFPVSGVDYILKDDGTFRFLEHNHFPGITLHDSVEVEILRVMNNAMDYLESEAKKR